MNKNMVRNSIVGATILVLAAIIGCIPIIGTIWNMIVLGFLFIYVSYYLGRDLPEFWREVIGPFFRRKGINVHISVENTSSNEESTNRNNRDHEKKKAWYEK
jgi:hypothetical protein